ncbi:MarR family winged helix-turn-helix transcriptional regulator [Paenibacillus sp. Leaf72]|uniref:MarR family winged helix-turn-helix transcriptional regulator n=1 Tax=Paenibacillus sp. Leaf72 TaxID=1736234 RepID=UPI0006F39460|nr:MarR family transcriptional regulator [Paenibacillus sp. Leaf72]KQO12385.1 transcriptional regulator [Paenibacillus sp. Leaf72]
MPYQGLEQSIGFTMGMTYRKLTNLFQQRLREYAITPEQWSVLIQISKSDGLIQKEIALRTSKENPTVTRIIDHLEKEQLIHKRPGVQDRRSFAVYITDKGRQLINETTAINESVNDEVKKVISAEEYELMISLLLRINHHLQASIEKN